MNNYTCTNEITREDMSGSELTIPKDAIVDVDSYEDEHGGLVVIIGYGDKAMEISNWELGTFFTQQKPVL